MKRTGLGHCRCPFLVVMRKKKRRTWLDAAYTKVADIFAAEAAAGAMMKLLKGQRRPHSGSPRRLCPQCCPSLCEADG